MEELMTIKDVAVKLRKAVKTVYHYVETHKIPPDLIIRLNGTSIRMKPSDFEKWVNGFRGV